MDFVKEVQYLILISRKRRKPGAKRHIEDDIRTFRMLSKLYWNEYQIWRFAPGLRRLLKSFQDNPNMFSRKRRKPGAKRHNEDDIRTF